MADLSEIRTYLEMAGAGSDNLAQTSVRAVRANVLKGENRRFEAALEVIRDYPSSKSRIVELGKLLRRPGLTPSQKMLAYQHRAEAFIATDARQSAADDFRRAAALCKVEGLDATSEQYNLFAASALEDCSDAAWAVFHRKLTELPVRHPNLARNFQRGVIAFALAGLGVAALLPPVWPVWLFSTAANFPFIKQAAAWLYETFVELGNTELRDRIRDQLRNLLDSAPGADPVAEPNVHPAHAEPHAA